MSDLSKWSTSKARVYTYDQAVPRALQDPVSISCYLYDPNNVVIYQDNKPLKDSSFAVGVFDFSIPGVMNLSTTSPTGDYMVVTVAQLQDGTLDADSEIINVS